MFVTYQVVASKWKDGHPHSLLTLSASGFQRLFKSVDQALLPFLLKISLEVGLYQYQAICLSLVQNQRVVAIVQ
jgi:hypothetical protein